MAGPRDTPDSFSLRRVNTTQVTRQVPTDGLWVVSSLAIARRYNVHRNTYIFLHFSSRVPTGGRLGGNAHL